MVGPPIEYQVKGDEQIFDEWLVKEEWNSEQKDASKLIEIAKETMAAGLVVDDYRVQDEYQSVLHVSGIPWLQFDSNAKQLLWADIIVNANPSAPSFDYKSRSRNRKTKFLLGPRYAILRPEFPPFRLISVKNEVRRILVTFGGGDDRGAIEFVLPVILSFTSENVKIIVVSGEGNPQNKKLGDWINTHGLGRTDFLINPPSISRVFASCDLAVMAGGTSTYEASACGLPMLLITIADNQERQAKAWAEIGAAYYLGNLERVTENSFYDALNMIMNNSEIISKMSLSSRRTVDGLGAVRVSKELETLIK